MSKPEVLLTEAVLNLNPRPDASRKTWMTPTDFTVKVTRNNTHLTNQETGVGEAGVTVTCLRDRGPSTESPAMLIFLCLPKASLKECIHSAPSRGLGYSLSGEQRDRSFSGSGWAGLRSV